LKKQLVLGLVALLALAALVVWGRDRIHFDFGVFCSQLALADWRRIAFALALIYLCYVIRSVRWGLLLRHIQSVGPFTLLSTQVIGFTAVALIGRIADPVRPYLVAKKTGLPLGNQIAVYIVERLLDAGAMALIFFSVILLAPAGELSHPEVVKKVAYGGLTTTVAGGLFLMAVRIAGGMVAALMERLFGVVSSKLGKAVGDKIRTFRTGLDTMRSFSDFAAVGALSLLMWGLVTMAYLEIMHAFIASPQLAGLTLAKCMMLMAWGMVASILQLPVIGWFSQIGFVAAAMINFNGVAAEPATACAATLLLVSFLGIVPIGLIWAHFEHVSLRKLAAESGHAKEELAID